ncbi:MAG: hypothetical protein V4438_02255 [Patescibacteria group bacterium]
MAIEHSDHGEYKLSWKKYALSFVITLAIFGTAIYISNYFNDRRIEEMRSIQDSIATNIMSSETEVSLLSSIPCEEAGSSMLSSELNPLAEKIEYSEKNIGAGNSDVISLKKAYALLEIKDYLLMRDIAKRCGNKFGFALYFYGDAKSCPDCDKASYVLSYLRGKYPDLRVYSFDYNLDLGAVKTLESMLKIKNALPAIVLDREVLNGFQSKEALEKTLLAHYPKLAIVASTTAPTK